MEATRTIAVPLQPVTFGRLDALCAMLGTVPDVVLTGGVLAIGDVEPNPGEIAALVAPDGSLEAIRQEERRFVEALLAEQFIAEAQAAARSAAEHVRLYEKRCARVAQSDPDALDLSQSLANLPLADSQAAREMLLEDLLYDLGLRAIKASMQN